MNVSTKTGRPVKPKIAVAAILFLFTTLVIASKASQVLHETDMAPLGNFADLALTNEQIKILYTDEAVSVSNYTDDTFEPTGWELLPSIYWDSNLNGALEANESIGHALSPSLHFTHNTQSHHFWPLHQSLMQDPGDPVVLSSGWISYPNIYVSTVQDQDQLVTLESTISIYSGNRSFTQEINVTSTASLALTEVSMINYIGFDINGPFHDYAFIDGSNNNMLKARDNETGIWFGAYPTIPSEGFEVSEWNDGPYEQDDLWQHTLNNALSGGTSSNGDIEASLRFNLDIIQPNQSRTITIIYSFAKNESGLYTPEISNRDIAVTNFATSKTGCHPAETVGQGQPINLTVTVENQGGLPETFNLTLYANNTEISSQPVLLNQGETQILTIVWNTAPFLKGNYSLEARIDLVPGETDIADNTLQYGWIFVTLNGDVDGDRDIDIFDIVRIASKYLTSKPNPQFDPNADLDDNGTINIFDVVGAATNYKQSW